MLISDKLPKILQICTLVTHWCWVNFSYFADNLILIHQPFGHVGAYDTERRAYQKINNHRLSTFTQIDKHDKYVFDNLTIMTIPA